jgi:hypothetical protein
MGEIDVKIHVFFTSAVIENEWSASRPCSLPPEKKSPEFLHICSKL